MIVGIHQPNFLPWLGYFYKITHSDVFIILDDVLFSKGGYTNRVKIHSRNGPVWLTVPVSKEGISRQLINEVEMCNQAWHIKVLKTLHQNYSRCPHFIEWFDLVSFPIEQAWPHLMTVNMCLIRLILNALEIKTEIIFASKIIDHDSETLAGTKRLLALVKAVGGDTYLSGSGGAKYQTPDAFKEAKIELQYADLSFPRVEDKSLSIIHHLFTKGQETRNFLRL